MEIKELLAFWDSNEGKPYKGNLIDWDAWEERQHVCTMCAQGQVLHTIGGWEPERLCDIAQSEADAETAKLLNISLAHAVLLRNINDKQDGAPSVVLTDPGKVLGDQWSKLLDFWWAFDQFGVGQWWKVSAARDAAGAARDAAWAARAAAWAAAWDAARDAAWDAAGAARDAAWAAAWDAAWAARAAAGDAARDAAGAAAGEIQGFVVLTARGRDCFFLPMFGWQTPADIPARPADYGKGVVPAAQAADDKLDRSASS